MTAQTSVRSFVWPEHWAIVAAAEADRIEHQMRLAAALATQNSIASVNAIEGHLAEVRAACSRRGRSWIRRRSVFDRWRGASVERAFRHLHAAKCFLVHLLPQSEVDALFPDVLARLAKVLDRDDPRRTVAERALRSPHPPVRRAALQQAMVTAYEASDEEYVRLRDFRNIIVLTTIRLALFIGGLLAVVTLSPKAIPLCFEPSVTAGTGAEQATTVCPSGDRQTPTGGDILIVAGLGAVGGGLGALFAIRNLRGTSTPYGIPTALAVLKAPAGALTAVIGILLLAGGFVPGLSNLDSQRQILAYALLFGYAQQLITRLVDDQGQSLLNTVPSKDSQAEQSMPATAPPAPPTPVSQEIGSTPEPALSTDRTPDTASPTPYAADAGPDGSEPGVPDSYQQIGANDNVASNSPSPVETIDTTRGGA
jgi:hypothetical protein